MNNKQQRAKYTVAFVIHKSYYMYYIHFTCPINQYDHILHIINQFKIFTYNRTGRLCEKVKM